MNVRRRSLLVTGTDTGIGKTLVGCAIGRALRDRGVDVVPFKPAETGCRDDGGVRIADDAERLRHACATPGSIDLVCPYRLRDPLAPAVAAEREGITIDHERIFRAFRELSAASDVVLVESAGGLLVPLAGAFSFADLARELSLPLLVVIGTKLGAINHALLTLEVARARGLEVAGYVLNRLTPESDLAQETNAHAIAARTDVPCLAEIPYLRGAPDGERLGAIGRSLAAALFD